MKSIGAYTGQKHSVNRWDLYENVLKLYENEKVVEEYPLFIAYNSEKAIDGGGVTRDMFSAFWNEAYRNLFDGATMLVPFVHPKTKMANFPTIGRIISHGYLAGGILPVRISLPSLLAMLIGPTVDIPKSFLLDALMDFISKPERDSVISSLRLKAFAPEVVSSLISILSRLGCREVPTPTNLPDLIVQVSKYEFLIKPMGAISMIHAGVPNTHKQFWTELGVEGVCTLYQAMTITTKKVLSILTCADFCNPAEERVYGYLLAMIGVMSINDLRNFMRFTTGSSVCFAKKIKVFFNDTTGLGRHPFANTCVNTLHLPVSYFNYDDFSSEWSAILSDTDSEWKWCMDAY